MVIRLPSNTGIWVYLRVVLQIVGKTQQQHLALFLKQDGAAFEKHIRPHLIAIFQEAFGMFQFEVIIMVIGLRPKRIFLYVYFHLLGFLFLLALFQLIKEFRVINDAANRRLCIGRYFHEICVMFFSKSQCLSYRINLRLYFIAHNTDFFGTDLFVNPMLPF